MQPSIVVHFSLIFKVLFYELLKLCPFFHNCSPFKFIDAMIKEEFMITRLRPCFTKSYRGLK